jgi:hypothetical protein
VTAEELPDLSIDDLAKRALCAEADAQLCRLGRGLGGRAAIPGYERERRMYAQEMARRLVRRPDELIEEWRARAFAIISGIKR